MSSPICGVWAGLADLPQAPRLVAPELERRGEDFRETVEPVGHRLQARLNHETFCGDCFASVRAQNPFLPLPFSFGGLRESNTQRPEI